MGTSTRTGSGGRLMVIDTDTIKAWARQKALDGKPLEVCILVVDREEVSEDIEVIIVALARLHKAMGGDGYVRAVIHEKPTRGVRRRIEP